MSRTVNRLLPIEPMQIRIVRNPKLDAVLLKRRTRSPSAGPPEGPPRRNTIDCRPKTPKTILKPNAGPVTEPRQKRVHFDASTRFAPGRNLFRASSSGQIDEVFHQADGNMARSATVPSISGEINVIDTNGVSSTSAQENMVPIGTMPNGAESTSAQENVVPMGAMSNGVASTSAQENMVPMGTMPNGAASTSAQENVVPMVNTTGEIDGAAGIIMLSQSTPKTDGLMDIRMFHVDDLDVSF